ncbi:MAG: protein TolR [Rickettsiales bacterium]|nr:MAG: protein TolR [Rickettsiales bacterium]
MALVTQNNTSRGRKRRKLMNEINVTPMVDVMLVLLIIFMITSPMLVAGIDVDLPKTESSSISSDTDAITIGINKKEEIYIFETKIELNALVSKLEAITQNKKDRKIIIKADKDISYGTVIEILAHINNAGFTKVGFISDIKYK